MKLNEEEKRFILHWAIDYKNALQAALAYNKTWRTAYKPNQSIEEVTASLEFMGQEYGHYKFWYGVLYGLIHCASFGVRNTIYAACSHALQNITNAAYYPSEKVTLK